jgi:hypothetical protein
MRGPDKRWAVDVRGLREFQASIRILQPELKREVPLALKRAGEEAVLPAARSNTPLGPGPRHMRDRWRVVATQSGAALRNADPGARTMEYGGRHPVYGRGFRLRREGPRGRTVRVAAGRADWTWVSQRPVGMARRALVSRADAVVRITDRELGVTFRRNGWGGR